MSKKEKGGNNDKKQLDIILITAILNLISALIALINRLIE